MELAILIYLIDIFANEGGPAILGVTLLVCFFFWAACNTKCFKVSPEGGGVAFVYIKLKPYVLSLCIPLVLFGLFFPNEKTSYKMLAAYGVTEVVMSETVQTYAKGSLKMLDKAMQEHLGSEWTDIKKEARGEVVEEKSDD